MAASVPQIPKIVTFTIATVSFKEDVIDLAIVPDGDTEISVLTLDGVTHKEVTQGGWRIVGKAVQDWDSARPGFAYYCYTHRGETVAFVYNAHGTGAESASAPKFTGSCVLSPLSYGGEGNVFSESDFTFPITGTLVLDATP
jgi:hypothetical protein